MPVSRKQGHGVYSTSTVPLPKGLTDIEIWQSLPPLNLVTCQNIVISVVDGYHLVAVESNDMSERWTKLWTTVEDRTLCRTLVSWPLSSYQVNQVTCPDAVWWCCEWRTRKTQVLVWDVDKGAECGPYHRLYDRHLSPFEPPFSSSGHVPKHCKRYVQRMQCMVVDAQNGRYHALRNVDHITIVQSIVCDSHVTSFQHNLRRMFWKVMFSCHAFMVCLISTP